MMGWQLLVSLRYLTSRRKEKFISLISLISILGIAIGVGALIIVIAVMSGFDEDLTAKITGTYSHIEILSDYGVRPSKELTEKIRRAKHVVASAYFMNAQALARSGDNVTGVVVKGIVPADEVRVNRLGEYIKEGSLDLAGGGIVIGSELAHKLGVGVGGMVSLVSPSSVEAQVKKIPLNLSFKVEGKAFRVAGIFTSGMYEYDMNLAYIDLKDAQTFFETGGLVSGMAVKVDGMSNAEPVKRSLKVALGPEYSVRTWMDLNKSLMSALKLEKTVMFIILTLIVTVACFNIASTLIMTVLEKTKDIGILKAIGATNFNVMAIFALQGGIIGIAGTAIGAGLGIAACWCLKTYKFISLPKEIYYIDTLPVRLDPNDIYLIIVSSILISFVATIYPAYRAARLNPVEALRYE